MVLSLGGTAAGGFVKFLVDSFGGSTEYDQAEAQAMLNILDTQNPDDTELANLDLQQDEVRGLLVAVGRCNTQVRLSLIYVSGQPPRPPVPRIPLRKVLRSVTHKQDARIVDKVYW